MPPNIPQLEEPERQNRHRRDYIAEVGSKPTPESVPLMADELHFEALNTVADRSRPSVAREELSSFYKRHAVSLRHKKYKMLGRWAC